jgi:hypothetical protein
VFPGEMKRLLVVYAIVVCAGLSALAAEPVPPPSLDPATGLPLVEPDPEMPKFDFNFQGGPVELFVEMLEKASQMPVNILIPPEHNGFVLPPFKLRDVTLPQLFAAITSASLKQESRRSRTGNYQIVRTQYGFKHTDKRPQANTVWHFFVESPPADPDFAVLEQPICRFWQLEPYLGTIQVEDITTAIETGWKMLKTSPAPKISFHKETKLLIGVGSPSDLTLVDSVLQQLTTPNSASKDTPANRGQPTGERPIKR